MAEEERFVEWDQNDPENPLAWSKVRKWYTTLLAVLMTLYAAVSAGIFAPCEADMMQVFGVSREVITIGITVYPLGFGIGPLLLAPLSELQGRNPVYFAAYIFFILFFIPQALATNVQTVIVARFFSGMSSSVGATMVGGSIADIWENRDRGPPMALFGCATLLGTSIGPLIGGFIVENPAMGWRWTAWIQMILNGALLVVMLISLKETRNSIALTRKAKRLRRETGNQNLVAPAERQSLAVIPLVLSNIARPTHLLFTEPIVFFFSLWVSFTWGILYLFLQTVGQIFSQSHNFSESQIGMCFIGMTVGSIIGFLINPIQEFFMKRYNEKQGKHVPEGRLILSCGGAILFTVGLFWFGWTSGPNVPAIVPIIAIACISIGIYTVYTAVFNYLADCYSIYASSALAAQSWMRNMFGCSFPLFAYQMNERLGFAWSMSLLGFIGAILAVTPMVLMWKGPQIRARSRFSRKMIELEASGDNT